MRVGTSKEWIRAVSAGCVKEKAANAEVWDSTRVMEARESSFARGMREEKKWLAEGNIGGREEEWGRGEGSVCGWKEWMVEVRNVNGGSPLRRGWRGSRRER